MRYKLINGEIHPMFCVFSEYNDEYCDHEVFRADCSTGDIIMMQSATYGHMQIGKCIEADLGYLGCKADVMDIMDDRCSGKKSCDIQTVDESLRETRPCIIGIGVYLSASYTCIRAIPSEYICNSLSAKSEISYIPSLQIFNRNCPRDNGLRISGQKGQVIELSIHNLSPINGQHYPLDIGFVVDGDGTETMPIILHEADEYSIGTSTSNDVSLVMDGSYARNKYIISFRGNYADYVSF